MQQRKPRPRVSPMGRVQCLHEAGKYGRTKYRYSSVLQHAALVVLHVSSLESVSFNPDVAHRRCQIDFAGIAVDVDELPGLQD